MLHFRFQNRPQSAPRCVPRAIQILNVFWIIPCWTQVGTKFRYRAAPGWPRSAKEPSQTLLGGSWEVLGGSLEVPGRVLGWSKTLNSRQFGGDTGSVDTALTRSLADAAPPSGHYSGPYLLTTTRTLSCKQLLGKNPFGRWHLAGTSRPPPRYLGPPRPWVPVGILWTPCLPPEEP